MEQAAFEPVWITTCASVTGRSHARTGTNNQDAHCVLSSLGGRIVAAAVSDGAGSAPRSAEGAQHAVQRMAQALLELAESPAIDGLTAAAMHRCVVACIEGIRRDLAASGVALAQFHCTLVAALLSPQGNWVLQLGDSAALCSSSRTNPDCGRVWFDAATTRLHAGDRGQYANETRFITEDNFERHLHVGPLGAEIDTLVLMTDGGMDVAMAQGQVYPGFLPVVAEQLMQTDDRRRRDAHLSDWLADPRTYRITGDDKTMVIALRDSGAEAAWAVRPPAVPAQVATAQLTVAPPPVLEAVAAAQSPAAAGGTTVLALDAARPMPATARNRVLVPLLMLALLVAAGVMVAWWIVQLQRPARAPPASLATNATTPPQRAAERQPTAPSTRASVSTTSAGLAATAPSALDEPLLRRADRKLMAQRDAALPASELPPMLLFDAGLAVVLQPAGKSTLHLVLPRGAKLHADNAVKVGAGKVRVVFDGCEPFGSADDALVRCSLLVSADAAATAAEGTLAIKVIDRSGATESTLGLRLYVKERL